MVLQNSDLNLIRTQANGRPVVVHVIYTFDIGGAQKRIVDLVNDPVQACYHVIVALNGNFGAAQGIQPDAPCQLLRITWTPQVVHKAIVSAGKILRTLNPDVVCGYNWAGAEWSMAARLARVKRIFQIEDGFGADESTKLSLKRGWFRRLLLWRTQTLKMIVVSHTLLDIAQSVWKIPPKHTVYIPNGVDIDVIRTGHQRAAPLLPFGYENKSVDSIVIGWLGALRPEKCVDRLIKAFGEVINPHARLLIMGDGPLHAQLTAQASHDSRIVFTGNIDDPAAYLARLDGLALVSRTEQTPYVIMEAMAAGLACLTTDVGDCKRMLSKENASFVVEPDDLPIAMQKFVDNKALRKVIGVANSQKAQAEFSINTMRATYRHHFIN